jgi:uncharacterized protein
MKILITGASGLVGKALGEVLAGEGHTICRLVRPGSEPGRGAGFGVAWNPVTGELGGAAVGADAVVNLAGASIASGRWSEARKRALRSSRVDSTRALVSALAKMAARPRVLISASATGYYGKRGEELLTEDSAPGDDFLASIAKEWEGEALKAEALGIRVVLLRFGVILAKHGGALPRMMLPFRFGVGGKIGSGKQWTPWLALEDAVAIVRFALHNESVGGPINAVAPQPVRNAEFTLALAKVMRRPAIFSVPGFALRVALGEMADALLLQSQRAVPNVLEKFGYSFLYPNLEMALAAVLKDS